MFGLLTKYKLIAIGIATVVALTAAFGFGYKTASNQHKADQLADLEAAQALIQKLEEQVREKEREALAAKQNREVEIREVIKKVYIDRDTCSVGANSLPAINSVLKGTSPE